MIDQVIFHAAHGRGSAEEPHKAACPNGSQTYPRKQNMRVSGGRQSCVRL